MFSSPLTAEFGRYFHAFCRFAPVGKSLGGPSNLIVKFNRDALSVIAIIVPVSPCLSHYLAV
jgi:hypothetical protein